MQAGKVCYYCRQINRPDAYYCFYCHRSLCVRVYQPPPMAYYPPQELIQTVATIGTGVATGVLANQIMRRLNRECWNCRFPLKRGYRYCPNCGNYQP